MTRTAEAMERAHGARLEAASSLEVVHCDKYNVYSTPGHLGCAPTFWDVHRGIERLVKAVVSGCGDIDGSSILETTSLAIHLHRCGLAATLYAPHNYETRRHYDFKSRRILHYEQRPTYVDQYDRFKATRNAQFMAARLLFKHHVRELRFLQSQHYDALIIPEGDEGLPKDLIDLVTRLGAEHVDTQADETCADDKHKVYSAPGLTIRTDPAESIFDGIACRPTCRAYFQLSSVRRRFYRWPADKSTINPRPSLLPRFFRSGEPIFLFMYKVL
ncbi:unnamed protein product [Trichogramma brassicae]|uniref:Uncharacterized protein n=1 Tax=Trichogramma brassicae TaxID=86971 RepID=A0A6H5I939_9HYME|nr:unnamed protein product [Trichogramma brassicae]